MFAISNSTRFNNATAAEAAAYEVGDRDVANVSRIDAPVVVLVAKNTLQQTAIDDPIESHNAAWVLSSSQLSNLSPDSVTHVLSDTDHMIQLTRPEAVVRAIAELESFLGKQREVGR